MPEDHFVLDIRHRLAETKSHLEALESGHLRCGQQAPGGRWVDTTSERIAFLKRDIAMYETLLAKN
jgi:hypothetical protein